MISNFINMKRLLFFLMMGIAACTSYAANPLQSLLQAFDGRYNNTKGVTTREIIQPDNYYYSFEVENNPEVVKQLLQMFEEVKKNSNNINKTVTNGEFRYVLQFPDDTTVGATYPANYSKLRIFMQSNQPFTKNP